MANTQGVVLGTGLATTNVANNTVNQNFGQGKQGEALAGAVHGKYYNSTYAGNVFCASTDQSGKTIPVAAATAAVFVLYNPIGSGINVELLQFNACITATTTVVGNMGLGLISNLVVAPTSVTAGAFKSTTKFGGSASATTLFYTAATLAAAAGNFYWMQGYSATAGAFPQLQYAFDGQVILTPGSLVHLISSAAQTQASVITATFAEWPA